MELGQSEEATGLDGDFMSSTIDAKLKHLEFIQSAISRMSTSSFLFKGWAITVAAALSAFAAKDSREALLAIAAISTVAFWILDAYYLWLECCFRDLYADVAMKHEDEIDFSMDISSYKKNKKRRLTKIARRHHLSFFYGAILAVEIIGVILTSTHSVGGK